MIEDDKQIGRNLNRRELLSLLGLTGSSLFLLNCSTVLGKKSIPFQGIPSCVVKPELTEGPYFVDEKINRSDIRADTVTGKIKEGSVLELEFRVSQVNDSACQPLNEAMIDIWHCDSQGLYSDVSDFQFDTSGQNFLRGYQRTDKNGIAKFTTIYPGWYPGRAVHIHFKIRTEKQEFTSQLFFDEAVSDTVFEQKAYSKNRNRTKNNRDGIYRQSNGQLMLNLTETEKGHKAIFEIGLYI